MNKIINQIIPLNNLVGNENSKTRTIWIQKKLGALPAGINILDAGAGKQPYKEFCSHLKYISQDFNEYIPEQNSEGIHLKNWEYPKTDIISDIISIPVENSSFDAILCSEVIEHIPDPVKAIEEFSRIIKKNGYLILTAPFCSLTHFAPYHYSTGFNKYFYEFHLNRLGFTVIEMASNGNFFEYLAQEVRRIAFMREKHTTVKITIIEKIAIRIVINLLGKLSLNQKGSESLLNFGYHILAQKN